MAVINLASSATLTNVTVTASGGNASYGVYNASFSPTLTHVMATASGATSNYGVYVTSSASPILTHVTATGSGGTSNYGVYVNAGSSPILKEVSSNGIEVGGNTLFVPASGTDSENGALLLSVANEITGLGAASAANRYRIQLDAGTYDLGNNGLAMDSFAF